MEHFHKMSSPFYNYTKVYLHLFPPPEDIQPISKGTCECLNDSNIYLIECFRIFSEIIISPDVKLRIVIFSHVEINCFITQYPRESEMIM